VIEGQFVLRSGPQQIPACQILPQRAAPGRWHMMLDLAPNALDHNMCTSLSSSETRLGCWWKIVKGHRSLDLKGLMASCHQVRNEWIVLWLWSLIVKKEKCICERVGFSLEDCSSDFEWLARSALGLGWSFVFDIHCMHMGST
jgi:hypothetical protein